MQEVPESTGNKKGKKQLLCSQFLEMISKQVVTVGDSEQIIH